MLSFRLNSLPLRVTLCDGYAFSLWPGRRATCMSSWLGLPSGTKNRAFHMTIAWFWGWIIIVCLVARSCPTLCNPLDYSLPSSSVHRIFQARILRWVAISPSRGSSHLGIDPVAPALQADSLPTEPLGKPVIMISDETSQELALFRL